MKTRVIIALILALTFCQVPFSPPAEAGLFSSLSKVASKAGKAGSAGTETERVCCVVTRPKKSPTVDGCSLHNMGFGHGTKVLPAWKCAVATSVDGDLSRLWVRHVFADVARRAAVPVAL